MAKIVQTKFSDTYTWMKMCAFSIEMALKFVPKGLIDDNATVVSGNGLVPNRQPSTKYGHEQHVCIFLDANVNFAKYVLTQCVLVMPYIDKDTDQQWLR